MKNQYVPSKLKYPPKKRNIPPRTHPRREAVCRHLSSAVSTRTPVSKQNWPAVDWTRAPCCTPVDPQVRLPRISLILSPWWSRSALIQNDEVLIFPCPRVHQEAQVFVCRRHSMAFRMPMKDVENESVCSETVLYKSSKWLPGRSWDENDRYLCTSWFRSIFQCR